MKYTIVINLLIIKIANLFLRLICESQKAVNIFHKVIRKSNYCLFNKGSHSNIIIITKTLKQTHINRYVITNIKFHLELLQSDFGESNQPNNE